MRFVAVAVLVPLILSTLLARSESNPYSNIAARNVFALKPPPPPVPPPSPAAPPRPAPNLVLTGVADFSTARWAFVTRTDPGQKPKNLTLTLGETEAGVQLVALNARTDTATLFVDGMNTVTLHLAAATNQPPKAAPPPPHFSATARPSFPRLR
jgi:hypothetical protein